MSAKWTWIFGIATFASFVLAIIFFASTQAITARDASAVGIGIVFGGTLAAFIATFVFHGDGRSRRIARESAAHSRRMRLSEALRTRGEEITRLTALITDYDVQASLKTGEQNAMKLRAKESRNNGFPDDAASEDGKSTAALHAAIGLRSLRKEAQVELTRVRGLTDDEYLVEQKRLRGLD